METNINHTDNSSLSELLTAYYNNGLSSSEKTLLEAKAASDPFLADAMEGFSEMPQAINEIPNFKAKTKISNWMTIGGIAMIGILGSVLYYNTTYVNPQPNELNTVALIENNKENKIESISESKTKSIDPKSSGIDIPISTNKNKKPEPSTSLDNTVAVEIIEERETFVLPKIELTKKEIKQKQEEQVKKARTKSIGYYGYMAVDYSLIYSNEIPVETQFSGTDASRSGRDDQSIIPDNSVSTTHYSYKDYLKSTCKLMKDRKFISAINNFNTILTHFPNDVNAEFYLGYCYYELGQFNKAIPYFDQAMSNGFDFFVEDSQWFKANSLENLGNLKEAQKIYRRIKNNGGFYSSKLR